MPYWSTFYGQSQPYRPPINVLPEKDDYRLWTRSRTSGASPVFYSIWAEPGVHPSGDKDSLVFNTIALIQQATNTAAASSTVIVTIAAPAAGNCLVMCSCNSAVPVSTVTGGGVTWVKGSGGGVGDTWEDIDVWYGLNSTGIGTSITVTFTGATGNSCASVSEWSNIPTANAIDNQTNAGTDGLGVTVTTPVTNTTNTHDLIIGCNGHHGTGATTAGPFSPFVALTQAVSTSNRLAPAYVLTTANGSYSTTWTQPSQGWDSHYICLKASLFVPAIGGILNTLMMVGSGI